MDEQEKIDVEEVNEIENEIKYKIITLEEEKKNLNAKEAIEQLIDELNRIASDFRKWCQENNDAEKRAERKEKIQEEIDHLIYVSKETYTSLIENEDLKAKLVAGKQAIIEVTDSMVGSIDSTVQEVLNNPTVSQTLDHVAVKLNEIKHDERVQEGLNKVRKGTLKAAESAFEGLKKVLKADEFEAGTNKQPPLEIPHTEGESTQEDSE